MSDDLRGLPPRRVMPDDVRDRLRAEVRAGIGKPRRAKHLWYAAAAAVVVLAAGAVVATQQFRQQPVAGPPPHPDPGNELTLDAKVATTALDRCWAAVQAAGKTDRVPPREEWVPLFTEVLAADSVVAATAAGKPMFCETTDTTVTLSDPGATPAYIPGTHTGLLLQSQTGVVAGVVDAGSAHAFLGSRTDGGEHMSQSIRSSPVTGQFVAMTRSALWTTTLTLETPPAPGGTELPRTPAWLVMAVDRPVTAERTSPAGRALGECLNFAELEVIPDSAAYAPGPMLEADGYRVVLGRYNGRVVVCTAQPDRQRPGKTKYRSFIDYAGPQTPPARTLIVDTLGGTESEAEQGKARRPYTAALPTTAAEATIDFGIGTSTTTAVVDGMVATWVPQNIHLDPLAKVHVQARDAQGKVVYDGSLMLL